MRVTKILKYLTCGHSDYYHYGIALVFLDSGNYRHFAEYPTMKKGLNFGFEEGNFYKMTFSIKEEPHPWPDSETLYTIKALKNISKAEDFNG